MDFHRARRFITAALLLLAATASAQTRDGNLIEYGIAAEPPRMKIFRDGRVLIVDEHGAWQGRIDADRVANLESDLRRNPLLHGIRYVEFAKREPIPHGGLSYVRFGEDEVVLATPGIPLDRDWNAIIERVNAEKPATLTPFRPQQLRFYIWEWPNLGSKVSWPFKDSVPLAVTGDDAMTTSDPAVIAFVIDDVYAAKFPQPGIEDKGKLYQFGVESAPGWMDLAALQTRLEELWRASGKQGQGSGAQDGNLIEYGMGGFADGGHGPPMLYPPEVKIYQDGQIVFADKEGYWQGTIEPKRFERLKRDLAANALLQKSQLLRVRNGGLISLHGGMAYIRYRDADDEIIVAVLSHPHRGAYPRLLNRIRQETPKMYSRFRPDEMTFTLYQGSTWVEPVEWPFTATVPLHDRKGPITTSDRAAIGFVLDHGFGGFSWLQTNVRENGTNYEIILQSIPGFFEPGILGINLDDLRLSSQ